MKHAKQLPEVEALVAMAWREIRGQQVPGDSVPKATDAALLAVRSANASTQRRRPTDSGARP